MEWPCAKNGRQKIARSSLKVIDDFEGDGEAEPGDRIILEKDQIGGGDNDADNFNAAVKITEGRGKNYLCYVCLQITFHLSH